MKLRLQPRQSGQSRHVHRPGRYVKTCLQLNLCLSNVLLAATAARNLLRLSDLGADSLGAEVLQRVRLDGVDAQGRVGLDNGESTGHCVKMHSVSLCATVSLHSGSKRTEELLAAARLLDDLDQTGLQLLDGGHVVGEDTHISGLGGQVDLDDILGLVEGLWLCGEVISSRASFPQHVIGPPSSHLWM